MMDVTGKVQAAAGIPGPTDGLFITIGFQLSFKGPKMPQSRAVWALNTFIVMDAAAKAPQELQVSALMLLLMPLNTRSRLRGHFPERPGFVCSIFLVHIK